MRASETLFVLLVLCAVCSHCKADTNLSLPFSVHAATCIVNSTHCHCALTAPAAGQKCFKQMSGAANRCFKAPCAAGYKCDCSSDTICEKVSTTYYKLSDGATDSGDEVDCVAGIKEVPRAVVGKTTDLHTEVHNMFSLFVNNDQKGYSMSNQYKVTTAELRSGDVMGLVSRRMGKSTFGIKLRFKDMQGETRVMDENWYCSNEFLAEWLATSFDPAAEGWGAPSVTDTGLGTGFDANVPWMWKGDSETVYCRYVVP